VGSPLVTAADRMYDLRNISIATHLVLGQGDSEAVVETACTLCRTIEEMADQVIRLLEMELDRQNPGRRGRKGSADG